MNIHFHKLPSTQQKRLTVSQFNKIPFTDILINNNPPQYFSNHFHNVSATFHNFTTLFITHSNAATADYDLSLVDEACVHECTTRLHQLNTEQRDALDSLTSNVPCLIQGAPGTGKSEVLVLAAAITGAAIITFTKTARAVMLRKSQSLGLKPCRISTINGRYLGLKSIDNMNVKQVVKHLRKKENITYYNNIINDKIVFNDEATQSDRAYYEKLSLIFQIIRSCHLPFGGIIFSFIFDVLQMGPPKKPEQFEWFFQMDVIKNSLNKASHLPFYTMHLLSTVYRDTNPQFRKFVEVLKLRSPKKEDAFANE